jgi:hypothetical protein
MQAGDVSQAVVLRCAKGAQRVWRSSTERHIADNTRLIASGLIKERFCPGSPEGYGAPHVIATKHVPDCVCQIAACYESSHRIPL